MKRILFFVIVVFGCLPLAANTTWYNPFQAAYHVIQNQAWTNEIGKTFHRIPYRAESQITKSVWQSFLDSSTGLSVHFYTNATQIEIRYLIKVSSTKNYFSLNNQSSISLYSINADGEWMEQFGKTNLGDTIQSTFLQLPQSSYHKKGLEYRLFLPSCCSVLSLEIGVPDSSEFKFIPVLKEKPIVVLGASVIRRADISLSEMSWTNVLSRRLDYPIINLRYNTTGYLDDKMTDFINEIDASLYICDFLCDVRFVSPQRMFDKMTSYIQKIRKKNNTPILILNNINDGGYEKKIFYKKSTKKMNMIPEMVYRTLIQSGVKNLYLSANRNINSDKYVASNDCSGTSVCLFDYENVIRRIINMPVGNMTTTQAVSQRRGANLYEWKERHADLLERILLNPPRKIIIGNSIVHAWGGGDRKENGSETWRKYMQPAGYFNLGCGSDRIENLLWRVYHGALDGYTADEIILMIGTNNLNTNTDEEIVEGLQFLLKQIQIRQPIAKIKIIGILPRRGKEERVKNINLKISEMLPVDNCTLIDVGYKLLMKNNKIDETLFNDGLHPNEKGYAAIVDEI